MSIIRLDGISKQFTLRQDRPRSFQELFMNVINLRLRRPQEKYWALKDVSFQVSRGEMLGIIGENGAGKSTLLKLLTGIIEPTSGTITVNGRISALLELGAGFHPELTGRENIYLNGSILGLDKQEMDKIFDDIVQFSEMERFIDVPVKHYSSGMYMRLGFSIAIYVRPEILIVDEVLSVGDQAFQQRCLDRIQEMKRRGVTIILVSHNLGQVRDLCERVIWLDDGIVRSEGDTDRVLGEYVDEVLSEDEKLLLAARPGQRPGSKTPNGDGPAWRWGSREAEIVKVEILDGNGQERRVFETGEAFVVRMHFAAEHRIGEPQFGMALYHANGFHISGPNTIFAGLEIDAIEGEGYIDYAVNSLPLLEGTYQVSVALYDHDGDHAYDHHHQAYSFRVRPQEIGGERYGTIHVPSTWQPGPTGFPAVAKGTEE